MKKILFINQTQFGYHIDTYYYCKFLRDQYDITYICWDYGFKKITMEGINIIYLPRNGSLPRRNYNFISKVFNVINNNEFDLYFLKYFRGCSLLKIYYPNKKYIFDIRTGAITNKVLNRIAYNCIIKLESRFFENITIVSDSLRRQLHISPSKCFILPVGGKIFSNADKNFEQLNLIYVGTLSNRNLTTTIIGFKKFYDIYKNLLPLNYIIIGTGYNNELYKLQSLVKQLNLENTIKFTGYILHEDLKPYFDISNVGVSFVPITSYFNVQPSTKTFDYLLSGMPVIATKTLENSQIINSLNGVLISDDSKGFYIGLVNIFKKKQLYDSKTIRKSVQKYHWENIVQKLRSYIDKIL